MKPQDWKIFDKKGSNLNIFNDSFLNIEFITDVQNARGAEAYVTTDPSGYIDKAIMSNGGFNYDPNTLVRLTYSLTDYDEILLYPDASIIFKDVSIFDPEGRNAPSISAVDLSVGQKFEYPTTRYTSAIFLDPVSTKLVETEHLSFLEIPPSGGYIRPYDPSNSTLVFKFEDGDEEIKLFDIEEESQTILWTEELIFDVSSYVTHTPLIVNIGFRAEEEGVYERRLRFYHRIKNIDYLLGEILVNAQSIGKDDRYDILSQNFGLPNTKNIPHLFKRADINEEMPDWQLLNQKGKHMVLDHDQIMPYIGTYKGLINAIKWLGYEDIQVKEWFKNVKDGKKLSLYVPYEAPARSKTIKSFSPEERKNIKKLNQLSLIYCITRETGEIDEWGNPEIEECYEYNINEILIKLKSLKDWLEKNIIGVNSRITDITGEGVFFERYRNIIYSTQDKGHRINYSQSVTPITMDEGSELIQGDASIRLSLLEIRNTQTKDFNGLRLKDFVDYYWDPSNGAFDPSDVSSLWWDPSTIAVGAPFKYPLYGLYDLQWKGSVEKTEAGAIQDPSLVSKPILIYDNDIRFYDILDSSTIFNSDQWLNVILERGWFRDPSNDVWVDSIAYSFYRDSSDVTKYIVESSTGNKWYTEGNIDLNPGSNAHLDYAFNDNYKVPLFNINNFSFRDSSGNRIEFDRDYFLDIADGHIRMTKFEEESSFPIGNNKRKEDYFINFNYDTSLDEQKITLNVVYTSPRAPLYLYDPSIYYYQNEPSSLVFDNSIYIMHVNHIGPYKVEVFGFDGQNIAYQNMLKEDYLIHTKFPTIWSYIDTSCGDNTGMVMCPSSYLSVADISSLIESNLYPIFDRQVPLQGLTLETDINGKPYIKVPSISYFIDLPESGSISRFYNMTERVTSRTVNSFNVDTDFQDFNIGDTVNLVLFDKNQYYFINEVSSNVTNKSGSVLTIPNIPSNFIPDVSTEVYLLNDTERGVENIVNDFTNKTFEMDVSSYTFRENQLVGIIIKDEDTGYSWGSSFRVLESSTGGTAFGNYHKIIGNIPKFIVNDPGRYTVTAKHAFSTYADFTLDLDNAIEVDNNFHLYMENNYYHQYYLDSTFVYLNLLFDQEKVLDQWYDPSTDSGIVTGPFWPYTKAITVDVSTLVILDAFYESNNYMLGQKNIWTVRENKSKDIIFRVFNESVPFIFNEPGLFDVKVESYDRYGNLRSKEFEGLINVIDE
jgi:hypothetical protein